MIPQSHSWADIQRKLLIGKDKCWKFLADQWLALSAFTAGAWTQKSRKESDTTEAT